MITYGSNKFGLIWEFELTENTHVIWHGHRPDWLHIPREDMIILYLQLGSLEEVSIWAGQRLSAGSYCTIKEKVSFSSFF